uniref:rRNA adenine N(6)-methyltransferase n=1 Tax=Eucampia antarctica TaxID=49252 RepID=A0A7S2RTN6_9STRA
MAEEEGGPLNVIGNLPYYITSQILFALCDASHFNAVRSATVTMQWEVAQRIVAPTSCKAYGILSVVFQLYADCTLHFKIPPTVFYPKPKVDSALVGLHFVGPQKLRERLDGVKPTHLRRIVTTAFKQRRKTVRNGLKKMIVSDICLGDKELAAQVFDIDPQTIEGFSLRSDWATKRPEELTSQDFVQLTKWLYSFQQQGIDNGDDNTPETTTTLGRKVWRKMKHGTN